MQGNSLCIRLLFWEGGVVLILQNWEPGDYSGTGKGCPVLRAGHIPLPVQLPHDPLSMGITYAWSMEHLNIFPLWDGWAHEKRATEKVANGEKPQVANSPCSFPFSREKEGGYWDILKWHPKVKEYKKPNKEMPPKMKRLPTTFSNIEVVEKGVNDSYCWL